MEQKNVSIDDLYFDPNNFRLVNNLKYKVVDDSALFQSSIQKKTYDLITGGAKGRYPLIKDIVQSMKSNGYLPVDNILVKEVKGKFIVIEGNRRLAALKLLNEEHQKKYEIGKLKPSIFGKPKNDQDKTKGVEVVLAHDQTKLEHLILAGLKHVSGNKKWHVYNQAKLLYELKKSGHYDLSEIAAKIGLEEPREATELIRGYYAIQPFIKYVAENEIGDDFNPYNKFMIFLTLVGKPSLRDWLGWDVKTNVFTKKKNLNRFFSWLVPRVVTDIDNDEDDQVEFKKEPPIIDSHKTIRKLADKINDEDFLKKMEELGRYELAEESDPDFQVNRFKQTLKLIQNAVGKISIENARNMDTADKTILAEIKTDIEKLLSIKKK